jgi:hypothetical protein
MQTAYNYVAHKQILEVLTSGVVETSAWPVIIRDSIAEGKKYACTRYIFDHRQAAVRVNLGQLFGMPRNAGEFVQPLNARIALLLPKMAAIQRHFIESFNAERGFNVKVFHDKESAESWLQENIIPPRIVIGG